MKRRLVLVLALLGVLVVAALFLLLPGSSMPTRKKIRLPDGNIVTVEKVTFNLGSQHDFSFDDSTLARFRRKLPRFLRRYFPSPGRMSWGTTSNSLVLWFTLADGKTGAPLNFHSLAVEVVDEHAVGGPTGHQVQRVAGHREGVDHVLHEGIHQQSLPVLHEALEPAFWVVARLD